MLVRMTRQDAANRMGVSTRTLDRRINAGEVQIEKESGNGRVHVLMDIDAVDLPPGQADDMVAMLRDQLELERERSGELMVLLRSMQATGRPAVPAGSEIEALVAVLGLTIIASSNGGSAGWESHARGRLAELRAGRTLKAKRCLETPAALGETLCRQGRKSSFGSH